MFASSDVLFQVVQRPSQGGRHQIRASQDDRLLWETKTMIDRVDELNDLYNAYNCRGVLIVSPFSAYSKDTDICLDVILSNRTFTYV